jgi:hypothetical protein
MVKPVRRRRRWLWLGLLPALVIGGFFAVRALLEPERLSAFLLQQASSATGLKLELAEPADVGLWPDLHLELNGLTATAPGSEKPLLRAGRVDAVLPWSALRSDMLQVQSLRLLRPELDVDAMSAWLAQRKRAATSELRLPQFDGAIEIEAGRIVGNAWAIEALDMSLASLHEGEPTTLSAQGQFVRASGVIPFDVRIATTPRTVAGDLHLDATTIALHEAGGTTPWLFLQGTAQWSKDAALTFDLNGEIPQWPAAWPALPFPDADGSAVRIALAYAGSTDLQGHATLSLARGDDGIAGEFDLGDIAGWLAAPIASPLPPVTGAMNAARLQFGSMELRGVKLRVEETAPAAEPDAKP